MTGQIIFLNYINKKAITTFTLEKHQYDVKSILFEASQEIQI